MSTLPEQFSAARKSQLEAQITFFQSVASTAVQSTEKLIALNLSATRASLEKSTAAVSQLLAARDPRDLLALTHQGQDQFESLLAYGRQLFSIASTSQADLMRKALPVVAPPAPVEPQPAAAPAAGLLAPEAAPVLEESPQAAIPSAPPAARAKPIAKAVSKVGPKAVPAKPAAAPFPAAGKPVVVTGLKAVEAAPPPAPVSGKPVIDAGQADTPAAKTRKKAK